MKPGTLLVNLVKKIPTISAQYAYEGEKGIHPTYCDIEHTPLLCPHEKKIWVLRSDLILAVGTKNIYFKDGNTNILDVVDESAQPYIDMQNRYGHPSLAMPEKDYDGSVYYAGWLYQHLNRIDVFLLSGRYQNKKITPLQQHYLERYISMQFMEAYGEQDIVFIDWKNDEEMYAFLKGTPFPAEKLKRIYSPGSIKNKKLLDMAIEHGDDQVAIELFEAGEKFSPTVNKTHIIHILAKNGRLNHVQTFVERDPALIHAKDGLNQTPLLWAASRGHHEVVAFLITKGADVNLATKHAEDHNNPDSHHNYSPLDWAIAGNHVQTILILVNAGAKANPAHTMTALIALIKTGNLNLTQQLIDLNPSLINAIDKDGYTLLHHAAHYGQINIVNALIKVGADVNTTSRTDSTALMYAAANNHHGVVKSLLTHGAKNPFVGANGEELALIKFEKIDNITLWTLTEKKQYKFNPHRHVKIWLSKDPLVFMNEQNQLRLVQMRVACPGDEINLVYDSQLLSEKAHHALLAFCLKHDVKTIDVRTIILQCAQESEHQLMKIYEDEISHLDAGGNLAAASDILRWIEPVFRLGTYSDFDAKVSTKNLPKTILVYEEMLLNIGSSVNDNGDERTYYNNNIIAILNPQLKQIKNTHQFIINACAPATCAPEFISDISRNFLGESKKYNGYLTKLQDMYLGKTPRQFRANLPEFIQCLKDLSMDITTNNTSHHSLHLSAGISKLLDECHSDSRVLKERLYMRSVMESTGPSVVINVFPNRDKKTLNYVISAYSMSFYKPLLGTFSSLIVWNMSKGEYEVMASSDLSWVDTRRYIVGRREVLLHKKAGKIQKAWINHRAVQEGRLIRLKARIARNPESIHATDKYNQTSLLWAASRGEHKIVDYLITHGADINQPTQVPEENANQKEHNYSPLDWAVKRGHISTILRLMNAGAKANHSHNTLKGKTLAELIKNGNLSCIQILIKLNKTLLNQIDSVGYPPLHCAIVYGDIEIVRYLITEGADLNIVTASADTHKAIRYPNMSALDLAIERNWDLIAILLLEAGVNIPFAVNGKKHIIHILGKHGRLDQVQKLIARDPELIHAKDKYNQTPLLWAASRGHVDVVDYLVAQGADINMATQLPMDHASYKENNRAPLDWAIFGGHATTILTLSKAGAKANHTHIVINGKSLGQAIQDGDLISVHVFIQCNKALLNDLNNCGYTPLHYAAYYGRLEIARYLIAEGADLNVATLTHQDMKFSGMTAMDILLQNQNHDPVAILLLEAGADIPPAINGKYHVIHLVAKNGLLNHVHTLIERDPELVHLKDGCNQTPLLWAASKGHHEVVVFFIIKGTDIHVATQHADNHKNPHRHHNYSSLDWAIEGAYDTVISILIKAGAVPNHLGIAAQSMILNDLSLPQMSVFFPKVITSNEVVPAINLSLQDNGYPNKIDYDQQDTGSIKRSIMFCYHTGYVGTIISTFGAIIFLKNKYQEAPFVLGMKLSAGLVSAGGVLIAHSLFSPRKEAKTDNKPMNNEHEFGQNGWKLFK